ncbi:MAG: hypothetical protein AAB365_04080 [Patescibacteria group bacterium]
MNATTKLIRRKPFLQPFAYLCIMLTVLTSHETVWARVANASFEIRKSEPAPAKQAQPELRLLVLETLSTASSVPKLVLESIPPGAERVLGVSLFGERALRILIGDKSRLAEADKLVRGQNPLASTYVDGDSLVVVFPESIVSTVQGALQEGSLDLAKVGRGPIGDPQNLFWCVVVLAGIGIGTYYGMKYLCKQAGLIPTNAPPPPKTNPPPPPPPTNRPPNWPTNKGPITVVGGFKMFNLVTESSVMPSNVHAALMAGTSPNNPLFKTYSDDPMDETLHGVAAMDASGFNELYESTSYVDPTGSPYLRCTKSIIQSASSLTTTGTTNWQNRMTMYIWYNAETQCISIYDQGGTLRENIVGPRGSSLQIESFDYVITHWYNPNGPMFFRSWSGLPAAP